jgi:hypothetical protein
VLELGLHAVPHVMRVLLGGLRLHAGDGHEGTGDWQVLGTELGKGVLIDDQRCRQGQISAEGLVVVQVVGGQHVLGDRLHLVSAPDCRGWLPGPPASTGCERHGQQHPERRQPARSSRYLPFCANG